MDNKKNYTTDIVKWIVYAGVLALTIIFVVRLSNFMFNDTNILKMFKDHMPTFIGLPLAFLLSFLIVLFIEIVVGPVELEGWGVKFNQTSGLIILWLICFLTILFAIRFTWNLK